MDILLLFSSILPMIYMKPPPKIAIIGGGIGGFSAAYFINEILPEATIDVYEKDGRIGGRMRSVELIGEKYEAGASIIHDKNLYMKKFREKFNLKKREKLSSNGVFVYVGRNRIEYPTGYSFKALLNFPFLNDFVNVVRFVFSCGVWDFFKLYFNTRRLLKNFVRIYEYQANGTSFETIDELLKSLPGLHQLTKISLEDYLRRDLGLGSRILTNLILPAIRVNYGQDLDVPALVGMISLAASLDGSALWSVQGGNELFVRFIYNYLSFNETILYGASPNGHGSNLYHHPDFLVDHDGCHLQGQPRNRKFNLYTGTNLVGMVYNNETATYELSFNLTGCQNHLDRDNSAKLYDTVILATPFPFIFPDVYPSPTTIEAGGDIKWCLNLDVSNSDHTFECLDEANSHTNIENKTLRNNGTAYRDNNLLRYHPLWVYLVDRKTADPNENIFGPVKAKNWLFPLISSRPYSYVDGIFTSRVIGTALDKNENAPLSNISRLETLFNSIGLQAPVTFGQKKTPKNTNSDISDDDSHHTYYEKKINHTGPEIGALQELDGYAYEPDVGVWKVFSNEPLSPQFLTQVLFKSLRDNVGNLSGVTAGNYSVNVSYREIRWDAYPEYATLWKPRSQNDIEIARERRRDLEEAVNPFPPIVLHLNREGGGVYHLNSIEWAASAMEMSAISAKNCALLARKNLEQKSNA